MYLGKKRQRCVCAVLGVFVAFAFGYCLAEGEDSARERTFYLDDGTILVGSNSDLEEDGTFKIVHQNGIHRTNINRVKEPLRTQLLEESNGEKLIMIEDVAGVSAAAPEGLRWLFGKLFVTDPQLNLLWVGVVLMGLSFLWMLVASFAESPVWGLCFLLFGITWIPFLILFPGRAVKPTLLGAGGIACFVVFAYLQAGVVAEPVT